MLLKRTIIKICGTGILLITGQSLIAQELYVFSEPASITPRGNASARINTMVMDMNHTSVLRIRNEAELKLGISKKFMLAGSFFMSDALNGTYRPEGGNLYGQYRFYSADDIHSHLRMAGFGRLALSGDPLYYDAPFSYYVDHGYGLVEHTGHAGYISESIDLGGSNSGFETGMIITKLKNKSALSSSVSLVKAMNNTTSNLFDGQARYGVHYSFSSGYLLFPHEYRDYHQTNLNLYLEAKGGWYPGIRKSYTDMGLALQFIFNSVARLDAGMLFQIAGNTQRMDKKQYLLRLEYNFLNTLYRHSKKQ